MPFLPLVGLGLLAIGVFKALTDSSEHAEGQKSSDDGAKPATDGESEDDDEDDEDSDDEQLDDEPYSDACDDDTDDTDSDADDSDNETDDETEAVASDEHAGAVVEEPEVADADQ